MQKIISIFRHLTQDQQATEAKKKEAHRKEVHTMMTMEATKVQFQGTFGTEVDKNAQERQKTLMPDDPELRKNKGLFSKKTTKQKQKKGEA
jgi:hypothetical protein